MSAKLCFPCNLFKFDYILRKILLNSKRNISKDHHKEIPLKSLRNIGIVAHIDAGKTTTTERMLYFSGLTDGVGEVHDGDTVTDYMEQERERGITITSAAVTFPWKKHWINLIDTPGHVDFTVEVERCLSVLDSAVVVLDSSRGVEAQTITVWSQADRHNIPRIAYLNKMDRPNYNVDRCLQSIRKIGSEPLVTQVPIRADDELVGTCDIIRMEKYIWDRTSLSSDGSEYTISPLNPIEDKNLFEQSMTAREELVGKLTDVDEKMSEIFLSHDCHEKIPSLDILNSVRRMTITRKLVPVFFGSSYKNVGVQPLMDAMVQYLPSPIEVTKAYTRYYKDSLCCLAFKVIHHKMLGPLTFVRVYSGQIKPNSNMYNVNRQVREKVVKIYSALAGDFEEIPFASSGSIVVLSGLTCITGDTLVNDPEDVKKAKLNYISDNPGTSEDDVPVLAGPKVPDPVFFCTIEPPSSSKEKPLDIALKCLQREDPSLKVVPNDEGQFVLSGMGELHLEILKDRLLREYKIDAFIGKLQVAYRETIEAEIEDQVAVEKTIGGLKNIVYIKLRLIPTSLTAKYDMKVIVTQDNDLGKLRPDHLKWIKNGVEFGLENGPILNFLIVGVRAELLEFRTTNRTSSAFIAATASQCVASAMKKATASLLEPMMRLEIQVPIMYSTKIISDLSNRRSQLDEVSERNEVRFISSLTPLSELVNYSTTLRSLSSGTAVFSMDLETYNKMNESEKKLAFQRITGIATG